MQWGKIDLHMHSTFSDGTNTPTELVNIAHSIGLKAIALTDHDTVGGIAEAVAAAEGTDLEVVPGVEVSTFHTFGEVHIVGLFVDYKNPSLLQELEKMKIVREDRNRLMCKRLREVGVDIHYSDLIEQYKSHTITRAIFADFLYKNGYVNSRKEAFDSYIGYDCYAFVKRTGIDPQKGIKLILSAGGIPILAHPFLYKLTKPQIINLADELKSYGLAGIEAFYSTHTPEQTAFVKELAAEKKLLLSGGSDYHGKNKPLISLGSGMGNLSIDKELLYDLKSHLT